jgi:outer membrane protein assembly factor BamB
VRASVHGRSARAGAGRHRRSGVRGRFAQARELLAQARDHVRANAPEAVRLYQLLLDEYGDRLVRDEEDEHLHRQVRAIVHADLLKAPDLLILHQRARNPEAERLIEQGRIDEVIRSRSLTAAGARALILAAQDALEHGRFLRARLLLKEACGHALLTDADAAHAWSMSALAAHFAGRENDVAQARRQLSSLRALDHLVALDEVLAQPAPAPAAVSVDALASGLVLSDPDIADHPMWAAQTPDSLFERLMTPPLTPSREYDAARARRMKLGHLNAALTACAGARVYVNEGHTVSAFERDTGRALWRRTLRDSTTMDNVDNEPVGDLNAVAVRGSHLITITGHGLSRHRSGSGRIMCLDADTGEPRWSNDLTGVVGDNGDETPHPIGAPVIADDAVIVLARRVSQEQIVSCFAVALSIHDGEPLWSRHVVSSSRSDARCPLSSPVLIGDDVCIASPVGAIAALNASSGDVRWLRSTPAAMTSDDPATSMPWRMTVPAVNARSVFAVTADGRRLLRLDRVNGSLIDSISMPLTLSVGAAPHLLADDDSAYIAAGEVRALDADDPAALRWLYPPLSDDPLAPAPTVAGRVQLADGVLVIPMSDGVHIVDARTGALVNHVAVGAAGNPLAVDAQLFIVTATTLRCYMGRAPAVALMRELTTERPDDPAPALAALQLGVKLRDNDLVMEAARRADGALMLRAESSPDEDGKRALFNVLLDVFNQRIVDDPGDVNVLIDLMRSHVTTDAHRVEFTLTLGEHHRETDPSAAVAAWARILDDRSLADLERIVDAVRQRAAVVAALRLCAYVSGGRDDVAGAREVRAAALAAEAESPDALLEAALRFPDTEAGIDAAVRCARMHDASGARRQAYGALMTAWRIAPTVERASRLLGVIIALRLDDGHITSARGLLRAVDARFGDIALHVEDRVRSVSELLADIDADHGAPPAPPDIGDSFGPGRVLEGRLAYLDQYSMSDRPTDRFLLLMDDMLSMHAAHDLSEQWAAPVDSPLPPVLHVGDDALWLQLGRPSRDLMLLALDARTGAHRTQTPRLIDLAPQPMSIGGGRAARMPDGAPFDPQDVMTIVGEHAVFIVQRNGAVVCFDRASGGLLWVETDVLVEAHQAIADDRALIIAGRARPMQRDANDMNLEPAIVLLDPHTGAVVRRLNPRTEDGVLWMRRDGFGALICGVREGVEAFDLNSGRSLWMNTGPGMIHSRQGWTCGGSVFVEPQLGGLAVLDTLSGEITARVEPEPAGSWDPLRLESGVVTGDHLLLRMDDRIVRFDRRGQLAGLDAVEGPRSYRWALPGRERIVVLSQFDSRQALVEGTTRRRTERLYRIYVFAPDGKLISESELPPLHERVIDTALIDGWLLLSTSTRTIALPMNRNSR